MHFTMDVSLGFIWLSLQLSPLFFRGCSGLSISVGPLELQDYSEVRCQKEGDYYYCGGLRYLDLPKTPALPCNQDMISPCEKKDYAPINEAPIHHVQVKFITKAYIVANKMPSSSTPYTTEFQGSSVLVSLKSIKVITALTVNLLDGNSSPNYTINISPDGINWEPLFDKGKALVIDSTVNSGLFCMTRKLFGKFLKIKFYSQQNNVKFKGTMDLYVTNGNGSSQYGITPKKTEFQGCYWLSDTLYEEMVHSGLTISQAVNLDDCLLHCSMFSFRKILVINAVHCACTNQTGSNSTRNQYYCNFPNQFRDLRASSVFSSLSRETRVIQFPNQVILHDVFQIEVFPHSGKYKIFYNLGDGNQGKTCSKHVTHRYRYLGTFPVSFYLTDEFGNKNTTKSQVSIIDPPASFHAWYPTYAVLDTNFSCRVTLSRGSNVTISVEYGDGTIKLNQVPDSHYYEVGEDPKGATAPTGNDTTIVFVGYPIKASGQLLGIELALSKSGPLRLLILRKPEVQNSILSDRSNEETEEIRCSPEMFVFENQRCCTLGGGCQSTPLVTQDLAGYKYSHDIILGPFSSIGYNYAPLPSTSSIIVVKGDIMVVQQSIGNGQLARFINQTKGTTAMIFQTGNESIVVGDTFQSNVNPVATSEMFAFKAILSSNRSLQMEYSYSNVGIYDINSTAQCPTGPLLSQVKRIVVQEKVHSVNITIPPRGLVTRTSVFNVEAFGTNLSMIISFGDGETKTFTNVQPIEHCYKTKSVFDVSIQLFNKVSLYWVECKYETIMPVENLLVNLCNQGVIHDTSTIIETSITSGDHVNISTNFGDGSEEHFVSNLSVLQDRALTKVNHSFSNLGAYNATAFATNGLSNETRMCPFYVEILIQGLNVSNVSDVVNAEENVVFLFSPQGGSNHTYNGTLNGRPIDVRCVDYYCSQANVLLHAGNFKAGENRITACVYNHVTLPICTTANFTAYFLIRDPTLTLLPAYLVDQKVDVTLTFQNGSDVTCFLQVQGHEGMLRKFQAGFAMKMSIACPKPGIFSVLANCSNPLNFKYLESNFTCMYPVKELILTTDSPQSVHVGINFTLSHVTPVPSNATCQMDYGDGETLVFEDCILPMNFSHKYQTEGDYMVNITVYNTLTKSMSAAHVKIEEPIEVIILNVERSPCDTMYGKPGGGPLKNMFPIECPMIFRIVRMDGTRPNVEWNFGDNKTHLYNNTVLVLSHTCAKEGLYNFTIKAYNRISSLSSHTMYECRPSVKSTILENSPFLTYQPAKIILILENPDFLTAVFIDFGDGEFQIVGTSGRKNDFPGKPYTVIDPMPRNVTVTHLFSEEGEFQIRCISSNAVSRHKYLESVVISLNKPCRKPTVEILNIGSFAHASHVRNETREHDFVITTHNVIDCIASRQTIFQWKVYHYRGSGLPYALIEHHLWKQNESKIIIPKQTLPLGIIRFEFVTKMNHSIVKHIEGITNGYITIVPSVPQVYISGGVRRTEDFNGQKTITAKFVDFDAPPGKIENVTWLWLARKNNESLPFIDFKNASRVESVKEENGCFGYRTGKLPFLSASFQYNASLITTKQTCHLQVFATREQRTATWEQEILFIPALLPDLNILCKINCENLNPVDILSYEGLSLNMDYSELDFEWQLWSEGKMVDLNGKTLSSQYSRNLVFERRSLEGGTSYKLVLFGWKKGDESTKGYVEKHFKTNDFPQGGSCTITPSIGYAVTTAFSVNCSGWKDNDVPISYRITIDSGIKASGPEINHPIYLPYRNGSVDLKVQIIDRRGNYNVTTVTAKIHTSEDALSGINEAIKMNGGLANEILGGNTQTASQLLSSIASVLIHLATEAGNNPESLTNIEEKLEYFISVAAQIPCQLPEDVLAVAESLVELTVRPDLLNHSVLGKAAAVFNEMLNVLFETKNLATVEQVELSSTNILTGIGNIMKSSSIHLSEEIKTGYHSDEREAKRVTRSLLRSMDNIFDLLQSNQLMGQNYTVIDSQNLALLTGVIGFEELEKSSLWLKGSSFDFPDVNVMQSSLDISSLQLPITVKMFAVEANPFLWTQTANAVDNDVVSLDLVGQSKVPLPVKNLTQKILIKIRNKNPSASVSEIHSMNGGGVSTHRINVTINDSSIHGVVYPINCSVTLKVTIRRNEYDCSNDYDYMWILPRDDTPPNYSFFVSNVELHRFAAGIYYICVQPMTDGAVGAKSAETIKYAISIYTGTCRYWDDKEDRWKGDGCEVSDQTSSTTTCCLCNHLTSFGGGFFVAPNPIDFGKVLAGFSDLASNPTVFAFIMSILGLYCILIIWARKADLMDARKAAVTKLPGNDHRDTFKYEITVYTGFGRNAGTSADVYLRLFGSSGDSGPRLLKDPHVPRFQRGAVERFLLTLPQSLGNLREIHIWHNNAGNSPGWFFFRMQARDCQTQKKWWFVGNKWLAVDEDDGKIERRFKIASQSELTRFNILFINATRRNLLDGHLWLSVFTRPVQSTFTRVQRLSCCLCLLLSTMLANAMFFQRGGEPTDTTVKIGPIRLSWSLIIIGIQSSFIVMPVNVLLVTIFRKLTPKEQNTEVIKDEADIENNGIETNVDKDQESEHDESNGMEESQNSTKKNFQTMKKKKFVFPYWCIYIAYGLCFFSSITCAAFTIFYGFTFGKEKSDKWLSVMTVSFFQSVIVIQPSKVFLLGLFFAIIIKDPNKEDDDMESDYIPEVEIFKDSLLIEDDFAMKKKFHYRPPCKETLERERALRLKERQMSAIIREIFLHFLVVVVVVFVSYGNHDDNSFPYSREAIQILTKGIPDFTRIKNDRNFWDWSDIKLIPNLYPIDDNIGYPYMGIMHNKKTSNMVGIGRLRQLRNKKHTCKVVSIFTGIFEDCTEDYSWSNEETKDFIPGWKSFNSSDTVNNTENAWKTPWHYRSAWELKGFPYYGKNSVYQGGGYIMELGPTNNTAFQALYNISKNDWIDQYTRAVFTEINIYNVNINLLCVITLLYEFLPTGGGIPSINVQTLKLFRYLDSIAKAVLAFEVVFLFLVLYWIYRDCKKIAAEGKRYWKDFWNIIDSLITVLSICSIGVYIAHLVFSTIAVDHFQTNRNNYVSFQHVVLLIEVLNFLTAFVVTLCSFKFLRLLRFNRKTSMLSDTLRHSSKMILSFSFMIFLVLFAFCAIANLTFGFAIEEYRTILRSMVSLFSMMLGQFHFQSLKDTQGIIGPIMFFVFMVLMQFILVNMFIGILSDNFNVVRTDATKQSNEFEIVDFMIRRMSAFFGLRKFPMNPDYKWPKTALELQVEQIVEKTDVIMDYMRNLHDEDLRTAIWLESDKSTDKKNKIISFILNTQHLDIESDLFDNIPVLLRKLDNINKNDLLKLSKKESPKDLSGTGLHNEYASSKEDDDSAIEDGISLSEFQLHEIPVIQGEEHAGNGVDALIHKKEGKYRKLTVH